jgi:hypothetical protein
VSVRMSSKTKADRRELVLILHVKQAQQPTVQRCPAPSAWVAED